ncbi:MAG: hypothetical protein OXF93_02200 [Acidobacteria bacterium]|nr:hypothetical protein [Acidobacteriota bacterium]
MVAIRDLARELKFTSTGSVRTWCDRQGIERVRRLPEGATYGQTVAFVTDADAERIRQRFAHRVASRDG